MYTCISEDNSYSTRFTEIHNFLRRFTNRTHDSSGPSVAETSDRSQRRLRLLSLAHLWGGDHEEEGGEEKDEDGHAAAKAIKLAQGTKRLKIPPNMRAIKNDRAPLLDTVDLSADEGFLWLPISMSPPICIEGEEDCEAMVRFCLITVSEYQENPWKYPMSVMLQKKSECNKADKSRAFHLSKLRVRINTSSAVRALCFFFGMWGAVRSRLAECMSCVILYDATVILLYIPSTTQPVSVVIPRCRSASGVGGLPSLRLLRYRNLLQIPMERCYCW